MKAPKAGRKAGDKVGDAKAARRFVYEFQENGADGNVVRGDALLAEPRLSEDFEIILRWAGHTVRAAGAGERAGDQRPRAAILAAASFRTVPEWRSGEWVSRSVISGKLSVDHRAAGGADGVRVLQDLQVALPGWEPLL